MVGRVQVEKGPDGSWRIVEEDGRLCHCWLPDIEDDDWLPLDRGGFDEKLDARGFALGVDLERARF